MMKSVACAGKAVRRNREAGPADDHVWQRGIHVYQIYIHSEVQTAGKQLVVYRNVALMQDQI